MNAIEFDQEKLARMDDAGLIREYLQTNKDSLCRMFGHNARQFWNLVVAELAKRGIDSIPNPFGAIKVSRFS